MYDFNFNLDNVIDYEIKEKYLPVRVMTATMSGLGDVAIAGCNPIRYQNLGRIVTSDFAIIENEETEYFVYPHNSSLYGDMVRKVQAMETWIPDSYRYYTIRGYIHGLLSIVHIDRRYK